MTPRIRAPRAFFALAALALFAPGCTSAPHDPHPADAIVVRAGQEPDSLNPFLSAMSATTDATMPIYSGLLKVDDELHFVPDLAVDVPTAENGGVHAEGHGMRVVYHLRHGVRWHDGKPFTSADVAFTARLVIDRRALCVEREGYDQISRVEAPDPYTAIVHFRRVYAPYLQLFDTVLPAHLLAHSKDINHDAFNRAPIGTGPYRFVSWKPGESLVYAANPDYFRGKPAVKNLVFRFIPDDDQAFVALKNGEIDVYQDVALARHRFLDKFPGVRIYETPALTYEHLCLNMDRAPFHDVRVRQAIAHAIDKSVLNEKAYDGLYRPAWCDHAPASWAYSPDLENHLPYDPGLARQLLDQAGWTSGPDGIRSKNGQRFTLRFVTTSGNKNREVAGALIRHFLGQVGIEVTLATRPGSTLFGPLPAGTLKSGRFDLGLWAWDAGPDPDNLNTWDSKMIPPVGQNLGRYRNPTVDHLLEAATHTFRQSERQTYYRKASHVIADDVPDVPLLYWTTIDVVSRRIENFKPNPSNAGNLWNVGEWRLTSASP